jgi:hypothetical protein
VHRVPTSEHVATIVRLSRAAVQADCPWLFPGVIDGQPLTMIGKLLGHTQAKTTQRCAHLADQPLRAVVDEVAALMRPKPRIVVRN